MHLFTRPVGRSVGLAGHFLILLFSPSLLPCHPFGLLGRPPRILDSTFSLTPSHPQTRRTRFFSWFLNQTEITRAKLSPDTRTSANSRKSLNRNAPNRITFIPSLPLPPPVRPNHRLGNKVSTSRRGEEKERERHREIGETGKGGRDRS